MSQASNTQTATKVAATIDEQAQFAPLEYGADYKTYTKMNKTPYLARTHGNRFVDVYVNDIALEAYKDTDEEKAFPVGSILVKPSWETKGGEATDKPGPTFVMVKKEPGFDPDNEDWWYAIHWENVPDNWRARVGGSQVYWRSPSKKAAYCGGCHENFDRGVGLVPEEQRTY